MNWLNIKQSLVSISPSLTISELLETNNYAGKYGLKLSPHDACAIIESRNLILKNYGRVELSINVTKNIINEFCSSPYLNAENYPVIINELIDAFYFFKNEMEDRIGDNELISIMKYFFNHSCHGSTELLKSRELSLLAKLIKTSS